MSGAKVYFCVDCGREYSHAEAPYWPNCVDCCGVVVRINGETVAARKRRNEE
jgi:DNA-directed RNA polymerase subunit RPC12/RpoP